MGLTAAREAVITALRAGTYQHEAREALSEKNLLAIGDITEQEVVRLVRRTRGDQYTNSAHDWDPATTVHVFQPVVDGQRWYVKVYFLEELSGTAVFISVHR